MRYLHTMVRVSNLAESLTFYCDHLGLIEANRYENEAGRFTLVFLCAPEDLDSFKDNGGPALELTYNWDESGYEGERNFGHLAYRVDNIYEACQTLMDAGVTINRPPRCGQMAFIRSPDNVSGELLQKDGSLEPMEPWLSMKNTGEW